MARRVGQATFILFLMLAVFLPFSIQSVYAPSGSLSVPTHMVFIVFENHPLSNTGISCSTVGPHGVLQCAPYLVQIGTQYANSTDYVGPNSTSDSNFNSLPNYLVLLSGSNWGCQNYDGNPNSGGCTTNAWNCAGACTLVDLLESQSITWKGYMEGLSPSNICNGNGGQDGGTNYIAHHDPFAYFNNIVGNTNRCANVVATTAYESSCTTANTNADSALLNDLNASNTPAFMWLTPNNYDNSHDCTLGQGANTFAQYIVPKILNSKTFLNDPTATLWITFDEPSTGTYGTTPLYLAVLGPGAKTAYTTGATLYTHRSLLHTFETNFSAGCIYPNHQDCVASKMFEFTKPDFYMNPGTWGCAMVTSCTLTVTLLPINGLNGFVLLSLLYWPTYTYTPSNVTVSPGVHSTSTLLITGTCSPAHPSIKAVSNIGTSAYGPGAITCPISPK